MADSHYLVHLAAHNHYLVAQSHHSPYMMAPGAGVAWYMRLSYTHQNSAVPVIDMQQEQACHNWDLPR